MASVVGMVKNGSEVSVRKCKTGSESSPLRREKPSTSSAVGILLPGRRRLLRRGNSSGSDSEGSEGEERTVPLPRPAKSSELPVFPKTGLRKHPFSSVPDSEDLVDSVPEDLTEDVIYVKTERVSLSQTFLTSWLIKRRSRV